MVSMVETSNSTQNDNPATEPVVPKTEPLPEGSISSAVSTPEAEGEILMQDVTQTQKRKGGRKPVRKNSSRVAVLNSVFYCFTPDPDRTDPFGFLYLVVVVACFSLISFLLPLSIYHHIHHVFWCSSSIITGCAVGAYRCSSPSDLSLRASPGPRTAFIIIIYHCDCSSLIVLSYPSILAVPLTTYLLCTLLLPSPLQPLSILLSIWTLDPIPSPA